ncbi:MAG: hypothetical protein A2845_00300 [Candidatus Lloydbacteria bacterium RIFCSPHIGHO2_01_FULL_49_22]|uniref:protein-glutamate methylesterase n=1 Tax=Candidatus Lloydbacteria bacterium RIFCSPHIGHO2_01_FULL_49_22 TaxID=1798658 RepID=A0A1G2CXZ9_9BACT|nr:MAG: hypothetical protein A2845_00300 [Candidatus Lloydbacteria bacterium RIFCSPHIGHO2_01_FULL_49_22]OGZ09305.1 MAG: hypothetical protein A3C14_05205 [Candidatus Lloydbacteria bacterium RIFCSPHIGHO2_02_FULL_50_18]
MNSQPTEKIRVLIADDSFFIRTYLQEVLKASESIEVVGLASSGIEVVELARKLKPHVITMDYHMPGKNGIEATAEIMRDDHPLPAIIMLSAFEGDDGEHVRKTLLSTGAHVIEKPSGEVSLDIEKIARTIVQRIEEVGWTEVRMRHSFARMKHTRERSLNGQDRTLPFSGVVVIGASTGGPSLVEGLIKSFDQYHGISIVIVQHMSAYFTSLFAERLGHVTSFRVYEAKSGDVLLPNDALVVPGGSFLLPTSLPGSPMCSFDIIESETHAPEAQIDNSMRAIAACYQGPIAGVLLSGMGNDGAVGLHALRLRGGLCLAQDPETAPVRSMPAHAIDSGEAVGVRIEDIPERIMSHFRRPSPSRLA